MINTVQKIINKDYLSYIIYVETEYNVDVNNYIRDNYERILTILDKSDFGFIYLPILFQSDSFQKILSYNRPYLSDFQADSTIERIYHKLLEDNDCTEKGSFLFQFDDGYLSKIHPYDSDFIRFEKELSNDLLKEDNALYLDHEMLLFRSVSDSIYDHEALQLAEDIKQKIEKLIEKGANRLIADIIESIMPSTETLSTLYITSDYRFFLKDYGMKEVRLGPLAKSLYLLYLKYPEGINFKDLVEFNDELLSIYKCISLRENIDTMKESIRTLTSPLSNSINENSSRIKSAFVEQITNGLAKNYYITGDKGEVKSIKLDRSFVEYQEDLLLF